jgi:importin subunit beta-1
MTSLTELLLATQDPTKCAAAEQQIRAAEQANADQYLTELAKELANIEKPPIARQLAGLLLKNGLWSKDASKDQVFKQRWAGLPLQSRAVVKEAATSALIARELDVGKSAAQVLAKIGAIEIPPREWPGLVPLLLQHVTNTDPRARQIALVTLNYLCDELAQLQEEGTAIEEGISDSILTAVVQGMRDPEAATKLEAARAFYHAVVLAQSNFKKPTERDFIMTVIMETCRCPGQEAVQIAAFECLVQIATEYYDQLMPYMNTVGPLTWETIKSAPEKVAIPAMEFWSTVCDEELFLKESGPTNGRQPLNLIQQALQYLVPLLDETLTRQQSEEDDDTWNLAMAAGTCLGLVAQVVGDACVDLVLGFVQANFENPDWKYREAAMLAYGSIMEGPTSEKMRPLVEQSYPRLVQSLRDNSVAVRDTIAWTLGRIAQFHPSIVPVKELMPLFCEKLRDVPRVASHICWCIQVMAEAQPGMGMVNGQAPATTALSEFFTVIAQALLEVVKRPDADDRQLRMSAYEALSVVVSRSGNDCMGHMDVLLQEMLTHLASSFQVQQGKENRECELQGFICGVLTALVQRMRERILPAADRVMEEALKVLVAYQIQVKQGLLQEEALLLVAAVANAVGPHFDRYMQSFAPHLQVGLQNYEAPQVCLMATGVVGDLCRALGLRMVAYSQSVLDIFFANLQNQAVDRKIKAAIMICFGDIAMATTGDFEKHLAPVVKMLQEASSTRLNDVPVVTEDWVDYLNSLREGVLDAYTGIIHGLRESNKLNLFKEHVNSVLHFVEEISTDTTVSESVMKSAVGVIGDLVMVFQHELAQYLGNAPLLARLMQYAQRSTDPGMQQTAAWMQQLLQKYSP